MREPNRALIVDDQPGLARGVALLLERRFPVDIATSLQEGIELVRGVAYDLVLSDLRMEVDDAGLRLLQLVAQLQPTAIRVLITGTRAPDIHPAHAVLFKPFSVDELDAVLARVR